MTDDEIEDMRPPELRGSVLHRFAGDLQTEARVTSFDPATRRNTAVIERVSRRERAPSSKKIDLPAPLGFFRRQSFHLTPNRQPAWHVVAERQRYTYTALCGYVQEDIFGDLLTRKSVRTVNLICARCTKAALKEQEEEKE